jgi:hypothetical protein
MRAVFFIFDLAIIFAVGYVAKSYGRRAWPWALLAFFFSLLAFIPLLIAGDRRKRQAAVRGPYR